MSYKLGIFGSQLIHHFEGIHDGDLTQIGLQPKMDCSGYWTEGWGHLMLINGKPIKGEENKELAYNNISIHNLDEAEKIFLVDITSFENNINALGYSQNQGQFDAQVAFIYNCGYKAFLGSTLCAKIKAKAQSKAIELSFLMWNKSCGEVLDGLIARRMTESVLFNTGNLLFYKCKDGILSTV